MPYRKRRNGKSRRPGLKTSIRYRKSARAQSTQLSRVASICLNNRRILNRHKTWSDFTHGFYSDISMNTWIAFPCIDPILWDAVMRQNANTREASNTFVRNVRMTFTLKSAASPHRCTWTIYLVKLRKLAADWAPLGSPALNPLRPDVDYTLMGTGNMPQLNMNTFEIIGRKTYTTFPLAVGGEQLGNPTSTQCRAGFNRQVNLNLRTLPLQSGAQASYWKNMTFEDVPYFSQLWLLAYPNIDGGGDTTNYSGGMDFSALFTCVNTD